MSEIPLRDESLGAACASYDAAGRERMCDHRTALRAAIAAFCETEGLTVDDDDGHNECYRLVSTWKEKS
jgi:hypothetical protein